MRVLSQKMVDTVEINPGEFYEVQGGVIESVNVTCAVASPPSTDELDSDLKMAKAAIANVSNVAKFGFAKNNDKDDFGTDNLSLENVEFKTFRVINPNQFTIIGRVSYTMRQ